MNRYTISSLAVILVVLVEVLLTCSHCAASQASGTPDEDRLKHLLEVIGTKAPAMPVPKEIEQTKDRAAREAYWAQRQARFAAFDAQINAATDELAAMGDGIIDRLVREYHKPIGAPGHQIIVVLAKIGTPRARERLLDIATAEHTPRRAYLASWAARNLVKISPNKEQIIPLLKSDDPDVLCIALQHLPGVSVDERLLGELRGFLQSTEYHPVVNFTLRMHAASVLATDGSSTLTAERVGAIVDSIRTVENMPEAHERLQPDAAGTLADLMYHYLIDALTKTEGATPFLRDAVQDLLAEPRAVVVVALALRGDSQVKHELRQLLREPRMVARITIRGHAARAMGIIGTKEDIDFLEQLSQDDPLEVINFHGPVFEMVNGQYVNTGPQMPPIKPKEDPAWATARRSHPVRDRAREAIRAIKMRTLVPELQAAGQMDAAREYADAVNRIIEEARNDPIAKEILTREIASLAMKAEGAPVSKGARLGAAQKEDFVYAMLLLDILTRVDRQTFLALSKDILRDARASSLYKGNIFGKVLGTRLAIHIVDPNALAAYDKGVLSLGLEFLDKEDGFRFTFGDGDRSDFRLFVVHLIGCSFGGLTLPPIDREKGLAMARSLVGNDRFQFIAKEWYMGQLAAFDPQVRQEYVRQLKDHVRDAKMPKRFRVRYAEKLVEMGELEADELRILKDTPEDPNAFRYESGHRQSP